MPLDFHIRRKDDLDEFKRFLGIAAATPDDVLEVGAREFERVLEEDQPVRQFPRPRNENLTPKQRIYLAIAVKKGEIVIPYERTGKLGRSYDIGQESPGRWHVRSIAPYASFVQGGRQSRYMKLLGWQKIPVIYVKHQERIENAMRKALFRKWSRKGI